MRGYADGVNLHLEALLLNRLANVNITLIHQDGPPQIITGVLGGHFQLGVNNDVVSRPHVAAGKIRVLASDIKSPLPGIPTFAEKGYPQINMYPVMALLGPKGMPPGSIRAWEGALETVMKNSKLLSSLEKLGFNINMITGTERVNKRINEEVDKSSDLRPKNWVGKNSSTVFAGFPSLPLRPWQGEGQDKGR